MNTIVGTILDIKSFLSREAAQVPMIKAQDNKKFVLAEDRKYIIPDYQREIRWEKENFIELLLDLKRNSKFLGNVILNFKEDTDEYEVIDGQQRTTMLVMIMHYLSIHWGEELDLFEASKLEVESFTGFCDFLNRNFEIDNTEQFLNIKKSDYLNQIPKYKELWDVLESKNYIESKNDFVNLYKNLEESEINIIVHTGGTQNRSIEHFLDVNLKGVKLDDEDIFKGYLFSLDSGKEIRQLWRDLKSKVVQLDTEFKVKYPLMNFIEHGLFCEFCRVEDYKDIKFGKSFTIGEVVELEKDKYYKGTHVVRLINNKKYMRKAFSNFNLIADIMSEISSSETPSDQFKNRLNKYNLDSIRISMIHHFLRKIIRDRNVVPKTLLMKFLFEVFIYETFEPKKDKEICSIFMLATFFSIFETSKSVDKFREIIMSEDWVNKSISHALEFFQKDQIQTTITKTQYKKFKGEDEDQYEHRSKSLAVIFNFFDISKDSVQIKKRKKNELLTFIKDNEQFSLEHFIVNNSGKWCFEKKSPEVFYPEKIKNMYKDSIFNFIFIEKELNSSFENVHLFKKISIIETQKERIKCDFSKMIVELVINHFKRPSDHENNQEYYENYIQNELTTDFSEFYSEVFRKLKDKFYTNK